MKNVRRCTNLGTKFWILKIGNLIALNPNSDIEQYSKIIQRNILRETIEKEVTSYYAWMKDDPPKSHFYFDYPMDGQFFLIFKSKCRKIILSMEM